MSGMEYELRTWSSLREIGEAALRGLESPDTPPFLGFDWLDALEQTGCVGADRGWAPMHVTLHREGELVGFAPAYLKGNSEGEFVFDHAWARFAEASLGIDYYPKLVAAVPFTPATGPRLLAKPGVAREELLSVFAQGFCKLSEKLGVSSAHVLFPTRDDCDAYVAAGLARRVGVQFQWHNPGYASFEDFLSRFSSKRRNQIRRERRQVSDGEIEVEVLTGKELTPQIADFVHDFYRVTVDKYFWGRRYLNRSFFEQVLSRIGERLHVVVARERGSRRPIAGAFNVLGADALYGRYWGALEDRPCLHFEVCFYKGIEDAIERRLLRFEPGAGGEHKLSRGFEPTPTYSAHHLPDRRFDRAVRDFVAREEAALHAEIEAVKSDMSFKPATRAGAARSE
jgi:uncharacterized protein